MGRTLGSCQTLRVGSCQTLKVGSCQTLKVASCQTTSYPLLKKPTFNQKCLTTYGSGQQEQVIEGEIAPPECGSQLACLSMNKKTSALSTDTSGRAPRKNR